MRAQFGLNSGSNFAANQSQNSDTTHVSTAPSVKFKTYFTALVMVKDSVGTGKVRKDTLRINNILLPSIVLPGYGQLYNRQYWKVPVVLGTVGTGIYFGYQNNLKYLHTGDDRHARNRDLFYAGAALVYWGSLLDGVVNYQAKTPVLPPRASLYSALLPGLGQAYNGDYWKIPIIYGGLIACGYFIQFNNMQYVRYKNDYNDSRKTPSEYAGMHSSENLKWFRDTYRRYRDYSVLVGVLVYALNIIDANVFAYFQDFDVSDDLTFRIQPSLIEPIQTRYAIATPPISVGLRMNIHF